MDYLKREQVDYFDMNEVHLQDFKRYNLSWEEYLRQFFVGFPGHYNSRGNHFFAHSIKGKIVEWLDPKPLPYRPGITKIDFATYLPVRNCRDVSHS